MISKKKKSQIFRWGGRGVSYPREQKGKRHEEGQGGVKNRRVQKKTGKLGRKGKNLVYGRLERNKKGSICKKKGTDIT